MRRERLGIGIAAVGSATVAIAVGHVSVPIGVVCSTKGGVAVQSAMERGGPTSR